MTSPPLNEIIAQVQQAINEDIGSQTNSTFSGLDVTASLIPNSKIVTAKLISREDAILCGQTWFDTAFQCLDKKITLQWFFKDGDALKENDIVCEISGSAQNILTAERTALNFLQTLSATATQTHDYVKALEGLECKILDTRKTLPGLRIAQKYAVACGGGVNHRIGLYDMVLIKENHIHAAGSIQKAVELARKNFSGLKIEVEVENLSELKLALENNVDRVLLDNMDVDTLKEAVKINKHQTDLEASGNITLKSVRSIAETGVDYISTGAITKNIQAIDYSLLFIDDV
ncbi:MAG: carboxylating nicotinate-nucleotide diphosphorylase [Woeseiaceae bacterium]